MGAIKTVNRALRICLYPGCNSLTYGGQSRCEKHRAEHEQSRKESKARFDEKRGTAAERGYNHRWQKARLTYLRQHPLCVECEQEGRLTPATVVDHIIPHKGDSNIFWNIEMWQGLCKRHHDIKTAKEDGRWG